MRERGRLDFTCFEIQLEAKPFHRTPQDSIANVAAKWVHSSPVTQGKRGKEWELTYANACRCTPPHLWKTLVITCC
jgi:hypothetical protein